MTRINIITLTGLNEIEQKCTDKFKFAHSITSAGFFHFGLAESRLVTDSSLPLYSVRFAVHHS